MVNLLWPGDERAGELAGDEAMLAAMVRVEQAWIDALSAAGIAPARAEVGDLVNLSDTATLATLAEASGNPVVGLVSLLRERLAARGDETAAEWLHRGLTSQDVIDTALMLVLRDIADQVLDDVRRQVADLSAFAKRHRESVMVGRTLTQHAVPTTFGVVAGSWLTGILEAATDLRRARDMLPVSASGAAGTLSATTVLAKGSGVADPGASAFGLVEAVASKLGLAAGPPWHVVRTPLTRIADALVSCVDAWGHVAADVLVLSRPEISEVAEPMAAGRGGSSTMPNKRNPVLSILLRRAAIAVPPLAATLHTAAGLAVDQRADGAWHAEWDTARTLARRTAVAASQASELVAGIQVDTVRMRERLESVAHEVTAERRAIANITTGDAVDVITSDDLGAAHHIVDAVCRSARAFLEITK
jgi:3-carboxy-cis,cis-muconate cycloisomerase